MSELHSVVLQKCSDYSETALLDLFDKSIECFELTGNLAGKKVLIKPNLISARGTGLACTNPQFIKVFALWCIEKGAGVCIGDSPAFGSGKGALQDLGILDDLLYMGVEIKKFSLNKELTLQCGLKVGVAADALDCDLFFNLPKMKAHSQMYVTIGLKNIFGIIKGMRKSILHMSHGKNHRQFAEVILDLLHVLPENITVVDSIEVMHRSGPIHGESLQLQCVGVGKNPIALETAYMNLLELNEEMNPLLMEAKMRRLTGSRGEDLVFPFLNPSEFWGSGFEAPMVLAPVRFHPFRFLRGQIKRMLFTVQRQ